MNIEEQPVRANTLPVDPRSEKDDLDAGADGQKFMLGYVYRIIDDCGHDA